MIKREAGFLGLAKQNAKRKGMVKVPKQYDIRGEPHYAIYATKDEMQKLKDGGGTGEMTKYDIPAFPAYNPGGTEKTGTGGPAIPSTAISGTQERDSGFGSAGQTPSPTPAKTEPKPKKKEYSFSYDTELSPWDNIKRIDVTGWLESLPDAERPYDIRFETDPAKIQQYLRDNPEVAQDAIKQQGGPGAVTASNSKEAKETAAYAADRKEDYDKKVAREGKKQGFLDEYTGFQGEAAGLGKESKKLTEGVFTDSKGRVEGDEGFDKDDPKGSMKGGFAGDVTKLEKYEDKFKDIAAGAKTRGDTAQAQYGGVMTDASGKKVGETGYDASTASIKGGAAGMGATALEGIGKGVMTDASGKTEGQAGYDASSATMQGGYKQVTGQAQVDAAAKGTAGFVKGAGEVSGIQEQFGKEGFQKDVRGLSEQALSGEVGQREAAMLKGRMEEQRMASQKGSEEKLRREMAAQGASPAEIAQKVAQFQRQSAAQQQQAGRSEALSSQLQGQQMGQSQLAQGAQLKGQEAGMAGKQAGLAVQQAALRGQGAAMQMQGAQGQQQAQLASLQGQGAMAQAGAGMRMQGVKGGAELGMAGAAQQGTMLGQGISAVQAAGGAREQQMGGLDQQGGFIDQQGNYVQAKLASTESDITQASTIEQARLTRKAQGTPDDPRYRPPEPTEPAPIVEPEPGTAEGDSMTNTGTTIPPVEEEALPMARGGPVQGGRPYIVGEKGRELFTPSQSGNITPNSQMPPSPTEIKQTGDHSFTVAQGNASAPASKGGINAPQPQLQGAPPPADAPQAPAQGMRGKESLNAARQDMNPQQLQESQVWEKNFDAYQQAQGGQGAAGMMGQQGMMGGQARMGQALQGNNQQAMMQNKAQSQAEITKQFGQAGQVRASWKEGGGLSGFGQGGGIAQQGGLMGQGQVSPEQQQMAEQRRKQQMQAFGVA